MAVATTIGNFVVPGSRKFGIAEITFTGSTDYLTGGILLNAATFGLQILSEVIPVALGPSLATGISLFSWDKANAKVKLYTDVDVEVSNAADISSIKIYALVKGV